MLLIFLYIGIQLYNVYWYVISEVSFDLSRLYHAGGNKQANKGKREEGRKGERGKNREECLNGRRRTKRRKKDTRKKTEGLKQSLLDFCKEVSSRG